MLHTMQLLLPAPAVDAVDARPLPGWPRASCAVFRRNGCGSMPSQPTYTRVRHSKLPAAQLASRIVHHAALGAMPTFNTPGACCICTPTSLMFNAFAARIAAGYRERHGTTAV